MATNSIFRWQSYLPKMGNLKTIKKLMTILQCRCVIRSDSRVGQLKTLSFIQAIPALIWLGLEANTVLYELSAAGSDGAGPGCDGARPAVL